MSAPVIVSVDELDDGYWLVLLKIPGDRARRTVIVPPMVRDGWATLPESDLLGMAARAVVDRIAQVTP